MRLFDAIDNFRSLKEGKSLFLLRHAEKHFKDLITNKEQFYMDSGVVLQHFDFSVSSKLTTLLSLDHSRTQHETFNSLRSSLLSSFCDTQNCF